MPSRRYKRNRTKKRRKYNSRKRLRGGDFFEWLGLKVPKKIRITKDEQKRLEQKAREEDRRSVSPKSRRRKR